MTFWDIVMVGMGGFVGAVIRYGLSTKLNQQRKIPRGTLLVNLAGALLIGVVFGLDLSRALTFLLASGLAGALTTFSTLTKELLELWQDGEKKRAVGYFLLTYVGGIGLVVVGYWVGGGVVHSL